MAGRGIDRLGMTRGRTIAPAIIGRAEMGATLQHFAWYAHRGLARIIAALDGPTAWILRYAASLGCVGLVLCRIPVGRPFPDIADHVVNAIAVGREGAHRRGARVAIGPVILQREVALPGVGHMLAARCEFITPGELRTFEATARGEFPLCLRWQLLAGPRGIGLGIL